MIYVHGCDWVLKRDGFRREQSQNIIYGIVIVQWGLCPAREGDWRPTSEFLPPFVWLSCWWAAGFKQGVAELSAREGSGFSRGNQWRNWISLIREVILVQIGKGTAVSMMMMMMMMMMMVSQFNGTQSQHQKGHTVPKQVIMIATLIQVATV